MIRVINLGHQLDVDPYRPVALGLASHFALWDDGDRAFVTICGDQAWTSWQDLVDSWQADNGRVLTRQDLDGMIWSQMPAWARTVDHDLEIDDE